MFDQYSKFSFLQYFYLPFLLKSPVLAAAPDSFFNTPIVIYYYLPTSNTYIYYHTCNLFTLSIIIPDFSITIFGYSVNSLIFHDLIYLMLFIYSHQVLPIFLYFTPIFIKISCPRCSSRQSSPPYYFQKNPFPVSNVPFYRLLCFPTPHTACYHVLYIIIIVFYKSHNTLFSYFLFQCFSRSLSIFSYLHSIFHQSPSIHF